MNIEKYKRSKIFFKYVLILGWLSIWSSLSFNPENLYYNFLQLDILRQIDYLRGLSQLIFFPVVLLIFIIFTYKDNILKKSNLIHNLLILFFFIQTIVLLFNENPNFNYYYSITSINVVLTTYIFKNYFSEDDTNNLLKINILILLLIFVYFSSNYIKESIIDNRDLYSVWGNIDKKNDYTHIYNLPRPTGLSRTALIILIFFSVIRIHDKNNFWNNLITVLTISMIILLSSRLVIILLSIFMIFYLFYFQILNKKKIMSFFKNFIIYPLVLILLLYVFSNLYSNYNPNKNILKQNIFEKKLILRSFPEFKDQEKINKSALQHFTSDRSRDWKNILKKNDRIIIGNGVMGDRFLINQSASNLLIYSYASSGLIGIILIIIVYFVLFIKIVNLISKKKKILESPYIFVSCIIIICLFLRSALETSFGVFGIDLFLFCSSVAIITKKTKE